MRSIPFRCKTVAAFVALAAALTPAVTRAQIVVYTDPVAFAKVSTGITEIDFGSVLAPTAKVASFPKGLTVDGVTFIGKLTGPDYLGSYLYIDRPTYAKDYAGWDTNPTTLTGPGGVNSHWYGYLQATLPAGITAVSMDIFTIKAGGGVYGGAVDVQVMTAAGSQTFRINTDQKPTLAFAGFTSASPIEWLRFTQPGPDFANLSHFRFGQDPPSGGATPVPSGPAVMLIGSCVWGAMLRLRKRAA